MLGERFNYCIYVVLLLIGLYAMIAKNNMVKKLIGMSIFQTAIILFYVSVGVKEGATIPIYKAEHDPHGHHAEHNDEETSDDSNASAHVLDDVERPGNHHGPHALLEKETVQYANPLPHVLMLTAIVVGVATLGVALALVQKIYRTYGTVEEDELLVVIRAEAEAEAEALFGRDLSAGCPEPKEEKSKPKRGGQSPKKSKAADKEVET